MPYRLIKDTCLLSVLLDELLSVIAAPPMHIGIGHIAFEIKIPVRVLKRLASVHLEPENAGDICAGDFHVVLSNILCRYPTIHLWLADDDNWFFEM